MAVQESDGIDSKVVGLYRKLVNALEVLASAEGEDSGSGGECAATDLAARIRELGTDLERLLDEDAADDGDYGGRAARVRSIEREMATLLSRVQNLGRQQHSSRGNGWSF